MSSNMFKITWSNVKSALVYGFLTLVAVFTLSILQSILDAGTILGLNWIAIIDKSVIATIPSVIIVLSLVKNFLTDKNGKFLGITEVIPDKK